MKSPVPVRFFIPYGVKYRELRKENIDVSDIQPIFIQVVRKPERLCIIKRGKCAEDYFPYCEEASCDVWGILMSMKSLCGEPVSMWLPENRHRDCGRGNGNRAVVRDDCCVRV